MDDIQFRTTIHVLYNVQSLQVLNKCFEKYQPDEVFLSFNGGKDCTVLLDLIINRLNASGQRHDDLQCWYIEPESDPSLPDVEEFVRECEVYYKIQIKRIKGKIKDALSIICATNPRLKAGIMGSRRTDPYCETLDSFQKTDPGWVELMRINPILVS